MGRVENKSWRTIIFGCALIYTTHICHFYTPSIYTPSFDLHVRNEQ